MRRNYYLLAATVLGCSMLVVILLGLWSPAIARAQTTCDNPDPAFTGEVRTFDHMDHEAIVSGQVGFNEIFLHGEDLFTTIFNECDGKGRPGATGSNLPTAREVDSAWGMNRVSGLDAGNCAVCHNIPRTGGGGDFATTVFVTAQNLDPQAFVVDGSASNERASPILFGVGAVELLAREMTYDLADLRQACIEDSRAAGQTITTTLQTHGVNFGTITCNGERRVIGSRLVGINADLIVRPFHQSGNVRSLREFTVNPLNHHHGIQAEERYGAGRTYLSDFDQDGVLTTDEATIGDVDALVIWQAFQAVPGQVLPDDPDELARVENGHALFAAIGCADCHVEELQTEGSEFFEPYDHNEPGHFRDQSRGFGFNLLTNGATPRFEPVVAGATSGPMKVRLFSDLRKHVICDEVNDHFCNEQIKMGTQTTATFMTAKLWGVGNTPPYGHRGDIATLAEAILAHGGEAVPQRNNYAALSASEKEDLILFLKSLQVLPEGATSLVMLQSEVDALNQSQSAAILVDGQAVGLLEAARDGVAGLPLHGSPLFFAFGLIAYPILRRREARYALHLLLGTLALSVLMSGVSLAARESAIAPAAGAAVTVGPPEAAMRVWGLNLPDPGQPVFDTRATGLQPAQGKVPLTVTFNNLSTGDPAPHTFHWDFGDGTTMTTNDLRQVRHTYTKPDVYQVRLQAISDVGSDVTVYPNVVFADSTTPWFSDVSATTGVIVNHSIAVAHILPGGMGAGWADYDNDGDEDLYVVQNSGRNMLWRNNADGTFTNVAEAAGVDDLTGVGLAMAWADYDNDSWPDLIVGNFDRNGANGTFPRTRLYHNNGDGTFTDLAEQAGLAADGWRHAMTFAWGDYDNDGLLDLYVVNHSNLSSFATPPDDGSTDLLFHQEPDHTFTNMTETLLQPSVNTKGTGFSATWVDFDKDGDQDLYIVNDRFVGVPPAKNILWRNTLKEAGTPGFVDWCDNGGDACISLYGMGLAVADVNLDGWQDMAVSNIGDSATLLGQPGLKFLNVSGAPGADLTRGVLGDQASVTWSEVNFDFDNNGGMDLYQVAGWLGSFTDEPYIEPNALFANNGTGRFADFSARSGLDDPGRGRIAALSDFDQDGWVDVYVGNYGEVGRLFHNDFEAVTGSPNNWLQIKLIGNPANGSNRDALGATVAISARGLTQTQVVGANVGVGGTNSTVLHFGVNRLTAVETVTITWPSGRVDTLTDIAANQRLVIEEQPIGAPPNQP